MSMRIYAFAVGAALLGVQAVQAQPLNGCPPGQAIQSSSPSGNSVTCVPIPDAAALRGAIDAEAAARSNADTTLSGEISGLRAKVEEPSIAGRWAFTGPQNCLASSTGFNATLQPIFVAGVTVLGTSSTAVSGVRIFGAPDAAGKGTGTASATFHTITHPTFLSPAPPVPASPFRPGSAAITTLGGTFSYEIQGENVIIDDAPAVGQIVKGFPGTIQILGNPRLFGKISKDRRTILLAQEDLVVEQSVFTPANGTPSTTTDRVCSRERTLIKLDQ